MERTQKIKILELTSKGMPLKQAVKYSKYPDVFIFNEEGISSPEGLTAVEADHIISEFNRYGIDILTLRYKVIPIEQCNINEEQCSIEEPEEHEYPSSPYPRKEKRQRIIEKPDPVATSNDWCLNDTDKEYTGRKLMEIKFKM